MELKDNQGSYRFKPRMAERRHPELGQLQYQSAAELVGDLGATGKGVGVAIIDSGIGSHPELDENVVASVVCIPGGTYDKDMLGHATHVAGVVAGRGDKVRGVAPDAKLISVQVVRGDESVAKTPEENQKQHIESISSILGALDWIVEHRDEYNIKVANLSVSLYPIIKKDENGVEYFLNPIESAIKKCVDAGITLVTAAGNLGDRDNSVITYPAACPEVITVGTVDTHGTADTSDDTVAPFSSRGPTIDGLVKPDLLAPGVEILSTNAPGSLYDQGAQIRYQYLDAAKQGGAATAQALMSAVQNGFVEPSAFKAARSQGLSCAEALQNSLKLYHQEGKLADGSAAHIALDGTSQSSPLVTGVVAAMYEVNPNLTPAEVKAILMETSHSMPNVPHHHQGAGVFDGRGAVDRARQLRK